MPIGLMLELLVAALLVVTVAYCYVLNRRLSALREGRDELKGLIENLSTAVSRAQTSVMELKQIGDATDNELNASIVKAQALADELTLMIEVGNNVADRIANSPRQAGGEVPADANARKSGKGSSGTIPSERAADIGDEESLRFIQALREAR